MGKKTIGSIQRLNSENSGLVTNIAWYISKVISGHGNTYYEVDCPVCDQELHVFPWSVAGSGKKCPNKTCETVFFSGGRGLTYKNKDTSGQDT